MVPARIGVCLTAVCCALACGARPDLPGPATANDDGPDGSGSAGGSGGSGGSGGQVVLGAQPDPPVQPSPSRTDASPPEEDATAPADAPGGNDPGQSVLACTEESGGCVVINIAVSDGNANSCIQLTLDDCESGAQPGLPVTLPVPWRLGAASVARSAENCVPGAQYNPMTTIAIVDASGSINWNLTTRQPSQLVLDLTLEPSRTALNPTPIRLDNSDLIGPLSECD